MIKRVVILIILFGALSAFGQADELSPLRFRYFANADSADTAQTDQNSECCDSTWHIEGKEIIVPSENDSLVYGKKIRKPWPTGALLRSAILPGWGQLYNRKYFKALLYGGTEIYLIYKVQLRWRQMSEHEHNFLNTTDPVYQADQFALYEKRRDSRNVHLWLTSLVVFLSMFDAYVDAHLAGFDQPDKAFQVYLGPEKDKVQLSLVYNFK